ncbi:virulence RhuM family protein [Mycolicibacterium vaccae]|uniref:virulence RhuM family protein n=1 Tax=Mycolicibacterium vaccae TaxID=1810 RepID=UPI003CF55BB3
MSDTDNNLPVDAGEFIVYRTPDGRAEVQLRAIDGTVWLTQAQMAELYGTSVPNINQLIARILEDGEVTPATIKPELIVRAEGDRQVSRSIKHYSLDMVLAVGYRVTSPRAVQFRQWATTVLREYLIKGFAMDDARLKDPAGLDYFDELLERIRDIRASEKRFYQKIKDIFAQTSVDYDKTSLAATTFFATIQNKLLFAVTGQTAAELVCARADAGADNMGLTTWKGSVVRKCDVTVAKNYLTEPEISELNLITTMFLDYAEGRARRRQRITMAEWTTKADEFLTFNEHEVLRNGGKISSDKMKSVAEGRYTQFDARRKAAELEAADREHLEELQSAVKAIGTTT